MMVSDELVSVGVINAVLVQGGPQLFNQVHRCIERCNRQPIGELIRVNGFQKAEVVFGLPPMLIKCRLDNRWPVTE
jgi:hypothetical protein